MWCQTHVNGWSRVIASQNGGSTSYIFPFRLRVLQWSRHLFNYWKNKKTIIEKFLILLIWNWIYIDYRKITWLWSQIQSRIKYMVLFPSYNLEIEKLHGKTFDLLILDLSWEAMLQGGKVLGTHLTRWNRSSRLWWPTFISHHPICYQSIWMLSLMCVYVINPNSVY